MPPLARVTVTAVALAALAAALTACVPESDGEAVAPVPAGTTAASPSVSTTTSAGAASATPAPSASATASTSLPPTCDDVYSADMRATLERSVPSLNDPGVTLLSTDQAPLLELLEVVPTLRCTWGAPSERGMSTNVSIVDAGQAATVRETLRDAGYGCEDDDDVTLCRIEQRGVSLDDVPYERGETQAVAGTLWVTTSWINVDPPGYTEDVLSTIGR